MWYCVHALLYFRYKDGKQDEFPAWENLYLIKAPSVETARLEGERRAKQDETDSDGTLSYNERPATLTFAGILRVVECEDLDMNSGLPISGTELSYNELTIPDKIEFDKLVRGESANVIVH
jgi:hypothetical protein